jgi:UDP-3-O-[3-hydroxymyristoyl] glucosamine N-acyltransferase
LVGKDVSVERAASLGSADAACLSDYAERRYRAALARTAAGAVILSGADADAAPDTVLIAENPELAFAHAVALLYAREHPEPGGHPSAIVAASAQPMQGSSRHSSYPCAGQAAPPIFKRVGVRRFGAKLGSCLRFAS